jgi:large subunit ribosomal protein L17
MRHRNAGRTLGRNATHRLAMFRNMTRALLEHDRIITTVAKAKELRPFVEKLITLAKRAHTDPTQALHMRRLALQRLPDKASVKKLFNDIAPRYIDRPGGYTRIIKRHERRLGDAGVTAYLELLKLGEVKVRAKEPAAPPPLAPTPKVEAPTSTPPTETPATENPPVTTPPAAESTPPPA